MKKIIATIFILCCLIYLVFGDIKQKIGISNYKGISYGILINDGNMFNSLNNIYSISYNPKSKIITLSVGLLFDFNNNQLNDNNYISIKENISNEIFFSPAISLGFITKRKNYLNFSLDAELLSNITENNTNLVYNFEYGVIF